jgi:hypothetical protein
MQNAKFKLQNLKSMLSNLQGLGQGVRLSSFLRKQESRLLSTASWIPACAGMTDQYLSEKRNLDKTDLK